MNSTFKILKKELIEVFRDKKSLAMMLIIPIFIPLMVIGMSALFSAEVNRSIDSYNRIGFNYELSDTEKELAENMNIRVYEILDNIEEEYDKGNIDLYVIKEDNTYTITGNDNDTSSYASSLMNSYFTNYKEILQQKYLEDSNVNADNVINIITVNENILTKDNYFGNYIINYTFLFIIMAITISATYPATDATAGEKERGTLETLLTFPIKSKDIIIGKFLSVSISSIITGILSLILADISLGIAGNKFSIYNDISLLLSSSELIFAGIVIIVY